MLKLLSFNNFISYLKKKKKKIYFTLLFILNFNFYKMLNIFIIFIGNIYII